MTKYVLSSGGLKNQLELKRHYQSTFGADDPRGAIDWEKAKRELIEYGDKAFPVYALREGEFKVFEV